VRRGAQRGGRALLRGAACEMGAPAGEGAPLLPSGGSLAHRSFSAPAIGMPPGHAGRYGSVPPLPRGGGGGGGGSNSFAWRRVRAGRRVRRQMRAPRLRAGLTKIASAARCTRSCWPLAWAACCWGTIAATLQSRCRCGAGAHHANA
jgi:hypothetical protein